MSKLPIPVNSSGGCITYKEDLLKSRRVLW